VAARRTRLALDQNFPTPILERIAPFLYDIEFVPLTHIDARLSLSIPPLAGHLI
jgi:hypothetical protein